VKIKQIQFKADQVRGKCCMMKDSTAKLILQCNPGAQLAKLSQDDSKMILEEAVVRAYQGLDKKVRKYMLFCGDPQIEAWAAKWLSGEDQTQKSAELAVMNAITLAQAAHNSDVEVYTKMREAAWETQIVVNAVELESCVANAIHDL